jgi:dTDP-4-dehydrorhamnose 3,5-epimerase
MNFELQELSIPDVYRIKAKSFFDARGFFMETYKKSTFDMLGLPNFVQDNYSQSCYGVLRGLHFQKDPCAQGKLVRCVKGNIWDVAVDIRPQSRTFGKWLAEPLNDDNHHMLFIPPGFAHGFLVLSEQADVIYKTTAEYAPDCDAGIRWDDPDLAIDWPIEIPIVSAKDAELPTLKEYQAKFQESRLAL